MADNPFILPPLPPLKLRRSLRLPLIAVSVALAVALAVSSLLFLERQKAKALVNSARHDLEASKAAMAALEGDKAQLEIDKAQLEGEKDALESTRMQLAKSVQAKEGELAQMKGAYDKFQEAMKTEIVRGDVHLEEDGGKLRVDLVDKVLFDSGDAQISKRGEEVLARVAEALVAVPDKQIQVSGHTDRTPIAAKLVGQYPTNWELSVARATNVVRFLTEKAKVAPQRLVASGYGEYQPVASNKSAGGRARNRRIEILLTPTLAPTNIAKSKPKEAVAQGAGGNDVKPEGGKADADKPDKAVKKSGKKSGGKSRLGKAHKRHKHTKKSTS
jgi:chemotaxis protein MotB